MNFILAGDSWALKGFTDGNYHWGNDDPMPEDRRLSDYWPWTYQGYYRPGRGNLELLDHLLKNNIDSDTPIIWVYTEPGRDYGRLSGNPEFGWIESENIFEIRRDLNKDILKILRHSLPNPIGLIGGLSDIDVDAAKSQGFDILHDSWQRWIADQMCSQWFRFGWGASDIGWRSHSDAVTPSKTATFAWDEQIKEWCWWEQHGWFCHEHPTPRAHQEFARFLEPTVHDWLCGL